MEDPVKALQRILDNLGAQKSMGPPPAASLQLDQDSHPPFPPIASNAAALNSPDVLHHSQKHIDVVHRVGTARS